MAIKVGVAIEVGVEIKMGVAIPSPPGYKYYPSNRTQKNPVI